MSTTLFLKSIVHFYNPTRDEILHTGREGTSSIAVLTHPPLIYILAIIATLQRTTNNTPRPQGPPILQLHQKPKRLSRSIQLSTFLMSSSKQTPSLTIIPALSTFRQACEQEVRSVSSCQSSLNLHTRRRVGR
jgi:hypothetical protein